jgi:hypothetical protein
MADTAKMCSNKRRYESSQAARFFGDVRGQRPYRCPVCGGWHLTTLKVKRRRGA